MDVGSSSSSRLRLLLYTFILKSTDIPSRENLNIICGVYWPTPERALSHRVLFSSIRDDQQTVVN